MFDNDYKVFFKNNNQNNFFDYSETIYDDISMPKIYKKVLEKLGNYDICIGHYWNHKYSCSSDNKKLTATYKNQRITSSVNLNINEYNNLDVKCSIQYSKTNHYNLEPSSPINIYRVQRDSKIIKVIEKILKLSSKKLFIRAIFLDFAFDYKNGLFFSKLTNKIERLNILIQEERTENNFAISVKFDDSQKDEFGIFIFGDDSSFMNELQDLFDTYFYGGFNETDLLLEMALI